MGEENSFEQQKSVGEQFELYLEAWLRDYGLPYRKNRHRYDIDLVRPSGGLSIEVKSEHRNDDTHMYFQLLKDTIPAQQSGPWLSVTQDPTSFTVRYNSVNQQFYIWKSLDLVRALNKMLRSRATLFKDIRTHPDTAKLAYLMPIAVICEHVPAIRDFDEFCKRLATNDF